MLEDDSELEALEMMPLHCAASSLLPAGYALISMLSLM